VGHPQRASPGSVFLSWSRYVLMVGVVIGTSGPTTSTLMSFSKTVPSPTREMPTSMLYASASTSTTTSYFCQSLFPRIGPANGLRQPSLLAVNVHHKLRPASNALCPRDSAESGALARVLSQQHHPQEIRDGERRSRDRRSQGSPQAAPRSSPLGRFLDGLARVSGSEISEQQSRIAKIHT
jgi:hypothetical protein